VGLTDLLRRVRKIPADTASLASGDVDAYVEFSIPNMVCEGCAEKLDGALHLLAGVRDVRSDVRQKRVHVRYEPSTVDVQQLKKAVEAAGFTVVEAAPR